jgi:hypothetical protein
MYGKAAVGLGAAGAGGAGTLALTGANLMWMLIGGATVLLTGIGLMTFGRTGRRFEPQPQQD